MYRKPICKRKIQVTTPKDGYYSGDGFLTAIDRNTGKVCVKFIGKGAVWFDRKQVKPSNWLDAV